MGQSKQVDLTGAGFRDDEAIRVFGTLYSIGVKVCRFDHPHGLNQYLTNTFEYEEESRKTGKVVTNITKGRRYSNRKKGIGNIRQIVHHHSGGDGPTPRQMYQTLHNYRGLSAHFAVEDGGGMIAKVDPKTLEELEPPDPTMIWQFLDPRHQAWHAGKANPASIGIENALYPSFERNPDFYSPRGCLKRRNLPHNVVEEVVHGNLREVFCMTEPQLMATCKLTAGLWVALRLTNQELPEIPLFPRNDRDEIPRTVATDPLAHAGLIGHLQLTRRKPDPAGFPWESFETQVGRECAMMQSVLTPG